MAKINRKALQTREELLSAACKIFSKKWYDTVSVSDISREAGRSNGVFYNYFKNKEDIFLQLLHQFLAIFESELHKISGESVDSRLDSFLKITIETGKKYKELVTLFREGQYRFNEMEQRLKRIYLKALKQVYGRSLSEIECLYVTGPLRFISIRSLYHGRPYELETLKRLITAGLFHNDDIDAAAVFAPFSYRPSPEPENTREILLQKANELFGLQGYHSTNIYDITSSASFAVGTFYRHFESKETILSELVEQIGRDLRILIGKNISDNLNQLEKTIRGFYIFIRHMEKHPASYIIVREAEFVIDKTVEKYYNKFEDGYLKQTFPGSSHGVTIANSFSGLGHYFGIEDIFSGNIREVEKSLIDLASFLKSGLPR